MYVQSVSHHLFMYCTLLPPRLEEALTGYMKDFAVRMKEIKVLLDGGEACRQSDLGDQDAGSLEEKEELLEELMGIVGSIDYARGGGRGGGGRHCLSMGHSGNGGE